MKISLPRKTVRNGRALDVAGLLREARRFGMVVEVRAVLGRYVPAGQGTQGPGPGRTGIVSGRRSAKISNIRLGAAAPAQNFHMSFQP